MSAVDAEGNTNSTELIPTFRNKYVPAVKMTKVLRIHCKHNPSHILEKRFVSYFSVCCGHHLKLPYVWLKMLLSASFAVDTANIDGCAVNDDENTLFPCILFVR